MKGKGKWVAMLFVLGLMYAGCMGAPSSSDGSPMAASDNPVMGTWEVSVDPLNAKIDIVPIVLGANSLEPTTSWTNQVFVTDLVNRLSATQTNFVMPAVGAWANLPNNHLIQGSVRVWKGGTFLMPTTLYAQGTNFNIKLGAGPGLAGGTTAQIQNVNLVAGTTVNIRYGYGSSTSTTWVPNDLTTKITIENHLNRTIEKLRTVSGLSSGPGAGLGYLKAGSSDYPLLQPQVGSTYAKPGTGNGPIDGWTSGLCYSAWGDWKNYSNPALLKTEGCSYFAHPQVSGAYWAPQWIDPVCGRITETFIYSGTANKYKFYMQLTGISYNWNPNYMAAPGGADSRYDKINQTTFYALMASLNPDTAGMLGSWCNNQTTLANSKYWWVGSLAPVKPADTRHCGTLITDPHMTPGNYFALNVGMEFGDTIEKAQKAFWDNYIPTIGSPNAEDVARPIGMVFPSNMGFVVLYDGNVLTAFSAASGRTGHSGSTLFPGGLVQQFTANYSANMSVAPKEYSNEKWDPGSPTAPVALGMNYVSSGAQGFGMPNTSFIFFTGGTAGSMQPYITQAMSPAVFPADGLPKFAGQAGFAHYNSTGQLITEGVDADLDFWFGMIVLKVRGTAIPGDWSYLKFDSSENNVVQFFHNNKTANSHPGGTYDDLGAGVYCQSKTGNIGTGAQACPGAASFGWFIFRSYESPNELLPPGEKLGGSSWAGGCPYGDGVRTCGGTQHVVGVVCVQ